MKLFFFLRQSKMVNHDLANSKYFLDVCCKLHAQHRLWSPVWSHDEDLDRPNGSQLLAREDYPGNSQSTWQIPTWQRPTSTKYIEREEKWPTMYFLLRWPWWGDSAILPGILESLLRFCQSCSSMGLSYNYQKNHLLNPSWRNALACHLGAKSCILRKCKLWTVHSALLAPLAQCTYCAAHILRNCAVPEHLLHSAHFALIGCTTE